MSSNKNKLSLELKVVLFIFIILTILCINKRPPIKIPQRLVGGNITGGGDKKETWGGSLLMPPSFPKDRMF